MPFSRIAGAKVALFFGTTKFLLHLFVAFCLEHLMDVLLAMGYLNLYAIFIVQVFGQVLRAVNAAVLSSGASKTKHEMGETALQVALNVMVGQAVNAVEEGEYLTVVLQESYHGLV